MGVVRFKIGKEIIFSVLGIFEAIETAPYGAIGMSEFDTDSVDSDNKGFFWKGEIEPIVFWGERGGFVHDQGQNVALMKIDFERAGDVAEIEYNSCLGTELVFSSNFEEKFIVNVADARCAFDRFRFGKQPFFGALLIFRRCRWMGIGRLLCGCRASRYRECGNRYENWKTMRNEANHQRTLS